MSSQLLDAVTCIGITEMSSLKTTAVAANRPSTAARLRTQAMTYQRRGRSRVAGTELTWPAVAR